MLLLIAALLLLSLCAATASAVSPGDTRRLHPWPLVSGTVGPERTNIDILFPFYHYERDGTFTYHGVRPFYSLATDPAREFRRLNILWPLSSFDRRGDYGRSYAFPLYRHRWGPDYRSRMLAPFYFHNQHPGYDSLHVWPFYSRIEKQDEYREAGFMYPLFRWRRYVDGGYERHLPWPIVHFAERNGVVSQNVLPVYMRNAGPDHSRGFFTLFYWNRAPSHSRTGLFPLWSHERKGDAVTDGLMPLYHFRKGPNITEFATPWLIHPEISLFRLKASDTRLHHRLFPIYSYRAQRDTGARSFSMLGPLFSYQRDPAADRVAARALLFYRERTGEAVTNTLPPLWYAHLDANGDAHGFATLYYWKRKGDLRSRGVFPLYRQHRNLATGAVGWSMLGPLFRYERDPEGDRVITQALLFYRKRVGENITNTLPPLWYMHAGAGGDTFGFAGLYFWKKNADGTSRGLFPLAYSRTSADGSRSGYAGLYYWRENEAGRHKGVFPLWHQGEKVDGTGLTMLLPFYLNQRRANGHSRFITPFWFDTATRTETGTRRTRVLFPLALDLRDSGTGSRFTVALPALWFDNRTPERDFTVQFPFYWHMKDRALDRELTYWFPFYGTYRQGQHYSRHLLFFPLYARYKDTTMGTVGWDVLWPLFHHDSGPDHRHTRALPLYWYSAGTDNSLRVVFPLYWSWREQDRSQLHLFPLYSRIQRNEGHRRQYFLGPLFTTLRDQEKDLTSWSAIFGLGHGERQGENSRAWALPFWWHERTPERITDLSPLLHHYRRDRVSGETAFSALWLGSPELSLWRSRFGPERTAHRLFPLYSYHRNHATGVLRWGIVPPLTWYARDPQAGTLSVNALLYYRRKNPERDFRMLLPVWWRTERGDTVTDSIPLLYRHARNPVDQWKDTALVWLIHPEISLWRKQSNPEYTRHRIPLVYGYTSNHRTGARGWNSLGGLIAHQTDPTRDFSLTRVLLFENRREGNYQRTALLPLWWHTRNGEASSTAIPLLYHGEHDPLMDLSAHSVLWLIHPEISVWRYAREGSEVTHRLFPLYRHTGNRDTGLNEGWAAAGLVSWRNDPTHDRRKFRALLYSREVTGTTTRTQFLPFYSRLNTPDRLRTTALPFYYHDKNTTFDRDARGIITLGIPQLSLYHHLSERGTIKDRLFPLYGYQAEPAAGRKAFSVLWPLFSIDRSATYRQNPDPMLSLVSYRKNGDESRFRFLWRLIYWDRNANGSSFEFNPLFGWDRDDTGKVREWWALFGIIGHRTRPDGTGDLLIFGF
ncbi:MAG: hypothetical protein OEY97_06800 [Nitrospirota bacterium]|nr:hypothetical protein [Nitrospirota bacterium]